jgi:hypothetical protein
VNEKLREEIDRIVRGRIASIETLAWGHLYDWTVKDRIIDEHTECISRDITALLQPLIEEARKEERERILREVGLVYDSEGELINYPTEKTWQALKE